MKTLVLLISLALSGCGAIERSITGLTGGLTYKCSKSGVEYVQSDSGIAVHLDKNGQPISCEP
jgi:uncharacterized protein YceK